ncbi:MAG: hypothetical protein ABIO70_01445 [Pseudomonadota bacterium]
MSRRLHPAWFLLPLAFAGVWVLRDPRCWPTWALAWAALGATEEDAGPCGARAVALTEALVGRDVKQVPVIAEAYERLAGCAASAGGATAAQAWMAAYERWAAGDATLEQRARMAAAQLSLGEGEPAAAEAAAFEALAAARGVAERIAALRSLEAAIAGRGEDQVGGWEPEDAGGPAGCFCVPGAAPCTFDAAVAALIAARADPDAARRWRLLQRALGLGLLELPVGGQLRRDTPAELYALGEWTLADRLLAETAPAPSPEERRRQLGLALSRIAAGPNPGAAEVLRRRAGR